MLKNLTGIFILCGCLLVSSFAQAQVIYPKKGYEEIKLGITYDDVVWILGFNGVKVSKDSAGQILTAPAEELGIDYDYLVTFNYIMDYPVTTLYVKGGLVVMITFNSYPEYNQFICQDMQTSKGLKFWDDLDKVKNSYGSNFKLLNYKEGNFSYYAYRDTGICLGVDNNQVRTMLIFDPSFK